MKLQLVELVSTVGFSCRPVTVLSTCVSYDRAHARGGGTNGLRLPQAFDLDSDPRSAGKLRLLFDGPVVQVPGEQHRRAG